MNQVNQEFSVYFNSGEIHSEMVPLAHTKGISLHRREASDWVRVYFWGEGFDYKGAEILIGDLLAMLGVRHRPGSDSEGRVVSVSTVRDLDLPELRVLEGLEAPLLLSGGRVAGQEDQNLRLVNQVAELQGKVERLEKHLSDGALRIRELEKTVNGDEERSKMGLADKVGYLRSHLEEILKMVQSVTDQHVPKKEAKQCQA